MNRGLWILGPLLLFFSCSIRGQDIPRTEWSPPKGLLFWLDATQAKQEWLANEGKVELRGTVPLDRWTDRSSYQRHFEQKVAKDRPMLHEVGGLPMVQFDGETDHLRSSIAEGIVTAATLFVVAAPEENLGDFRGLLAAHAMGKRDYQSGLNIDLGPIPTLDLEFVNVEGNGFVGATNLYRGESPFKTLKLLRVTVDPERKLVQLAVNQKTAESRPWIPSNLSTDEWTLGARFYTNGPGEQRPRGFLKGDIAEVMVFDRVLNESELEATENYLASKYAKVRDFLEKRASETVRHRDDQAVPIVRVSNPPAVQLLQPGFQVQTLPVSLTNINNVLYRHDGALVTLGYNGDIHLLRDTDGDGLEDQSQPFWKNNGSLRGPIGMVVAPKGYPKGNGVFVASKGRSRGSWTRMVTIEPTRNRSSLRDGKKSPRMSMPWV